MALRPITSDLLRKAVTPIVYNVSMATANTEYSQALPTSTKRFTFQLRAANDCKLAFTAGQSGTNYITIKSGSSYTEEQLDANITLYFQSAVATQMAEIIVWT